MCWMVVCVLDCGALGCGALDPRALNRVTVCYIVVHYCLQCAPPLLGSAMVV